MVGKRFFITALAAFLLITGAAQAGIRCTCPSIQAEGDGNTDCDAIEAAGWCTIVYNQFDPQLLQSTADQLNNVLGRPVKFIPETHWVDSYLGLANLAKDGANDAFFEALMLYLSVAAVVHPGDHGKNLISMHSAFFNDLDSILRDYGEILRLRMVPSPGAALNDYTEDFGVLRLRISDGCVEARNDDIWVMYKSRKSTARGLRWCSPDKLQ